MRGMLAVLDIRDAGSAPVQLIIGAGQTPVLIARGMPTATAPQGQHSMELGEWPGPFHVTWPGQSRPRGRGLETKGHLRMAAHSMED